MKKPSTTKPVTPVTPAKSPAPATSKAAAPAPAPVKKPAAPAATKPAATPPPATAKKAPAPAPAKAAAPAKAVVPAAAPAPAPVAPAAAPVATAAPVPAAPVSAPVSAAAVATFTVVTAKIDVGFGNTLYIRGDGPGLSWTKGLALKNAGADEWTISLPPAAGPIAFKFLLNDSEDAWSLGGDYSADPGTLGVFHPEFSQG